MKTFNDDAIVITATLTNFEVYKIMIDNGSAINVLFYDTLFRIKLPKKKFMLV